MQQRLDQFVGLSADLTGFSTVELLGLGVADSYLSTLDTMLPAGVTDALLNAYGELPGGPDREAAVDATICADPKLGPVAQSLILLWYCGSWTVLSADWHAAYGASPQEKGGPVSAEAYQAGLQWAVAGAHPPGSGPQGFGAWAMTPERTER